MLAEVQQTSCKLFSQGQMVLKTTSTVFSNWQPLHCCAQAGATAVSSQDAKIGAVERLQQAKVTVKCLLSCEMQKQDVVHCQTQTWALICVLNHIT